MSDKADEDRVKRLSRLLEGCGGCEYDEAEGGLFNHCATCQHEIVTLAYALIVKDGMQLKSIAEMAQLLAERDAARIVAKKRLELLVSEGIV